MKEKILPIITIIVLITAICVVIFVPKNSVVQASAENVTTTDYETNDTSNYTNVPSCCCGQPAYGYYASDSSSCCCGGMSGTSSCCGQ